MAAECGVIIISKKVGRKEGGGRAPPRVEKTQLLQNLFDELELFRHCLQD
jgi:hypothetical protein